MNLHDYRKIRALFFLKLRRASSRINVVGAGEIATIAGSPAASMYVLLGRWRGWGLVSETNIKPYRYTLGANGRHWLARLPKWYDGYQAIFNDVAVSAGLTICWVSRQRRLAYVIRAPFSSPDDFSVIKADSNGQFAINARLLIQEANCLEAINKVKEVGLHYGDPLIEKLISEGFIKRNGG